MEQSEERLSRINAYNKLVDAAILTKTSSKSVADIVNHELGIECNASDVQEILKSSVSASDMHKNRGKCFYKNGECEWNFIFKKICQFFRSYFQI
mgnify:CR=1 FL=1